MQIKKGKEKEWKKFVKINSKDFYSASVLKATKKVGEALDKDKTPEQAENELHGLGLTGAMAGCIAESIVHFSPRGKEFQGFWNKRCGGTGEEKGTINPAILEIKV